MKRLVGTALARLMGINRRYSRLGSYDSVAQVDGCLMPAFDVDRAPLPGTVLDSTTQTLWLRELLVYARFPIEEAARYTGPPLKQHCCLGQPGLGRQ